MTTTKRVNKSQAVREELANSTSGSPSEIVAKLAERGITVSAAFVSNIKSQEKKRQANLNGGYDFASQVLARTTNATAVSESDLYQASSLIMKAVDLVVEAGPHRARALVNMAEKLVSKVAERSTDKPESTN